MPKIAAELSALEVGRLKAPGLVSVGGVPGLCMQIAPSGARSWVLRAMVGSKRRDMGLGPYPGVTLAQAREKARHARNRIDQGHDPILDRERARSALVSQQATAVTFEAAALASIDAKSGEWRNPKHLKQWNSSLQRFAFPIIGRMLVADVDQAHVLQCLEPIWTTKTETASRIRGRIESVLDWARVRGYRAGENPARWRGHLEKLLGNPAKIAKVEHHPAVPIDGLPAFYADLHARDGMGAKALEFVLLTAVRSGEARGATWEEIDLDAGTWSIPASRMKGQREHRVPLSGPAMKLLRGLARSEETNSVFWGPRHGPLSDMTLTAVMRRMGRTEVPHGLRSSFRDWCAERTNFPRDLAEKALAHTLTSDVEAAYQRGDMLDRRRTLMGAWAKFLVSPIASGNMVVTLSRHAA